MTDEQRFRDLLHRHFFPIRPLSSAEAGKLWAHYELLVRWNRILNLTAIRDLETAVVRHYCESLFLAVHLPNRVNSILDVGAGAGFPGIPVAVLCPDITVVLAESHQRKAVFLREATRDYDNVRVEGRRAEELARDFDCVISRAVRWQDVARIACRELALLLGEQDAAEASQSPAFVWNPPIPLPWGNHRVLLTARPL